MIPCVLFEDEHLLVVNKPPGMNTHAPDPFTAEGIYDWLRHRDPRWANLAIIHRLDKETSGVMVFGKTPVANRSLTEQFTSRTVQKRYLLLTDRRPMRRELLAKSRIHRAGVRYISGTQGELAETRFRLVDSESEIEGCVCMEAEPLTGRTHQIRVHAAENGFPILGDALYGGSKFNRVCLHATELAFMHPITGRTITFQSPADFQADARLSLRAALINSAETNVCRVVHGASDGWPGWYVDRVGDFLLSQGEQVLIERQRSELARLMEVLPARGAYHKILRRDLRSAGIVENSPQLISGEAAPERFTVRENGLKIELAFNEGYSAGLFFDQRDNRRRLLTGHIAAHFRLFEKTGAPPEKKREVLNCFAYTCGFSVCGAKPGANTTSLDLSRKYLDWGAQNFRLNGLDPTTHDFINGDVFDWLRRLARRKRAFDVVLLDPPTFSHSKKHGVFRAQKDYTDLVAAALRVLKTGGVLFASTNAADFTPEDFLAAVEQPIHSARRKILQRHYFPQPPDFPISKSEPAYLKTVWLRME